MPENRPEVDVQPVLVEFIRIVDYRHRAPQEQMDFACSASVSGPCAADDRAVRPPFLPTERHGREPHRQRVWDVSGAVYADHGYPHRTRERGSLGLAHTGEARVRDEIVEQVHAVPLHIFVTSRSRREAVPLVATGGPVPPPPNDIAARSSTPAAR